MKTSESQRSAWQRWAAKHPEKAQANRNVWAKSPAGKKWLAANQKKKNKRRDAWRLKKRREAKRALRRSNADLRQDADSAASNVK